MDTSLNMKTCTQLKPLLHSTIEFNQQNQINNSQCILFLSVSPQWRLLLWSQTEVVCVSTLQLLYHLMGNIPPKIQHKIFKTGSSVNKFLPVFLFAGCFRGKHNLYWHCFIWISYLLASMYRHSDRGCPLASACRIACCRMCLFSHTLWRGMSCSIKDEIFSLADFQEINAS